MSALRFEEDEENDTAARGGFVQGQLEATQQEPVEPAGSASSHGMPPAHLPDSLVLKFAQGESLTARMGRGRMHLHQALAIAREIAVALAAMHRAGIVHRDLNPDNVLIITDPNAPGGERINLIDFGIAKVLQDRDRVGDAIMGKPGYLAPEGFSDASSVDHRADLYALGCIIFEMCAERPADITPEMEQLVQRLLAKDPSHRMQTAEQVIAAIDHIHPGSTSRTGTGRTGSGHPEPLEQMRRALAALQPDKAAAEFAWRDRLESRRQRATQLVEHEASDRGRWLVAIGGVLAGIIFFALYSWDGFRGAFSSAGYVWVTPFVAGIAAAATTFVVLSVWPLVAAMRGDLAARRDITTTSKRGLADVSRLRQRLESHRPPSGGSRSPSPSGSRTVRSSNA